MDKVQLNWHIVKETVSCDFDRIARFISVHSFIHSPVACASDVENYFRCFYCILFKNSAIKAIHV